MKPEPLKHLILLNTNWGQILRNIFHTKLFNFPLSKNAIIGGGDKRKLCEFHITNNHDKCFTLTT